MFFSEKLLFSLQLRAGAWVKQASEVCVKQTSQVLVKKNSDTPVVTLWTLNASYVK